MASCRSFTSSVSPARCLTWLGLGLGLGLGSGVGLGRESAALDQLASKGGDILHEVLGDVLQDLRGGAGRVRTGEGRAHAGCAEAWVLARLLRLRVQCEVRVGLLCQLLKSTSTGRDETVGRGGACTRGTRACMRDCVHQSERSDMTAAALRRGGSWVRTSPARLCGAEHRARLHCRLRSCPVTRAKGWRSLLLALRWRTRGRFGSHAHVDRGAGHSARAH